MNTAGQQWLRLQRIHTVHKYYPHDSILGSQLRAGTLANSLQAIVLPGESLNSEFTTLPVWMCM